MTLAVRSDNAEPITWSRGMHAAALCHEMERNRYLLLAPMLGGTTIRTLLGRCGPVRVDTAPPGWMPIWDIG